MPGFLGGGSTGSGGTGGEITFPKEFIDPVTKFRVSQPENLIDTDFEYGLQPTKWETVELINNTPSFFSKGGDTTIDGIQSVVTNSGTREITVTTGLPHNLAVGIPISVTGTKSITADGAYIINSIPNATTFTYLCKDNQIGDNSIEDLYTSIITGEFFQGSQIKVSNAEGIITDGESTSTLTVKTESTHGFGVNTPFYFLNLNSTISQEFESTNTAAKSFDSSNSATAQAFDGSNTLASFNIDWSNSATVGGTVSVVTSVNTTNDTITVSHSTEAFNTSPLGTPLYYDVSTSTGFFATNPRGVVFLKTVDDLGASSSTFQVSEVPDGSAINIQATMSGTFQLANEARTFSGNNLNPLTQTEIVVQKEEELVFDGGNQGYAGTLETNGLSTILGFTGDSILVSTTAGAGLDYYVGAMVRYSTTGSAASGLTNNTTYFIAAFSLSSGDLYNIRLKNLPTDTAFLAPSGGSGTQTFTKIGVSPDKDIVHIRNSNFSVDDMLEYSYPEGGKIGSDSSKNFFYVEIAYDAHNYKLFDQVFVPITATGGTTTEINDLGQTWRVHTFTSTGTSQFVVVDAGSESTVQYLIVGGGGAGGNGMGGGGGAGGVVENLVVGTPLTVTPNTYTITVGAGGVGTTANTRVNGGNSSAFGLTAIGGGGGNSLRQQREAGINTGNPGGSGGGAGGLDSAGTGGAAQQAGSASGGFGNAGGNFPHVQNNYPGAGGGGAGEVGQAPQFADGDGGRGGNGRRVNIDGNNFYYGGGGGGNTYVNCAAGQGGLGGGGGGSTRSDGSPGSRGGLGGFFARNAGETGFRLTDVRGGNGGANTGGGGGGGAWFTSAGGNGGSGIVIIRYPITKAPPEFVAAVATGGTTSLRTVDGVQYRIHAFTTVGNDNFVVQSVGSWNKFEYLIVGGGGGGGGWGGGGGGGGVRSAITGLSVQTYPTIVGGGGARGTSAYTGGANGGNSSAFGVTALGGGGGGWYNGNSGRNGATGGGAGLTEGSGAFGAGGTGTAGQGYNGGSGGNNSNGAWTVNRAGGGGGAGGPGNNGAGTFPDAGRGGIGLDFSREFGTAFGQAGWFGGGGGGHSGSLGTTAIGGRGGGGRGGRHAGGSGLAGLNGTANTGGGGGGAWGGNATEAIGDGGSGIILIRYPIGVVV